MQRPRVRLESLTSEWGLHGIRNRFQNFFKNRSHGITRVWVFYFFFNRVTDLGDVNCQAFFFAQSESVLIYFFCTLFSCLGELTNCIVCRLRQIFLKFETAALARFFEGLPDLSGHVFARLQLVKECVKRLLHLQCAVIVKIKKFL